MSSGILDEMRDVMRRRHYSIHTERSYCHRGGRFVLHFNVKSRDDLRDGEEKIERYLADGSNAFEEQETNGVRTERPIDVDC